MTTNETQNMTAAQKLDQASYEAAYRLGQRQGYAAGYEDAQAAYRGAVRRCYETPQSCGAGCAYSER